MSLRKGRLLPCWMWRHVVWKICTDVSEVYREAVHLSVLSLFAMTISNIDAGVQFRYRQTRVQILPRTLAILRFFTISPVRPRKCRASSRISNSITPSFQSLQQFLVLALDATGMKSELLVLQLPYIDHSSITQQNIEEVLPSCVLSWIYRFIKYSKGVNCTKNN